MERVLGDGLTLELWQRQLLDDILLFQAFPQESGKERPRLQWHGPDHVMVFSDEPMKEPVDYYKSASWKANREELLRHLKTWETT